MPAMSLMSRRAIFEALIVNALGHGARRCANPRPLKAETAGQGRRHARLDRRFSGRRTTPISTETRLSRTLPPPLVWEFTKGTGYASPAIAGERLVFLHRVGDEEIVECLHAETGASQLAVPLSAPPSKIATATTTARDRARSSTARASTRWARKGKLHCLDLGTGKADLEARPANRTISVPQDFFGTASTPLVEGQLLIVNVGAPGGPCVVGLDKATGREVWRAGNGVGAELRLAGSRGGPRQAARVRVRRRRVESADRRTDVDRSGRTAASISSFPWRSRTLRIGQRLLSRRLRQQGVRLGELSNGRRAGRDPPGLHAPACCGRRRSSGCISTRRFTRTAISTGSTDGTSPTRRSRASMRPPAKSCGARRPNGRRRSRPAAAQQQLVGTYRGSLLAVDGQFLCLGELGHLLWLDLTPKGYKEVSRAWLFAARESWALPVLSRGLLYVAQNTRDMLTRRTARGCSATTCGREPAPPCACIRPRARAAHRRGRLRWRCRDSRRARRARRRRGVVRPEGHLPADEIESQPPKIDELILIVPGADRSAAQAAAERGVIIGEGANTARTLSNRSANDVSPEVLADEARAIAERNGLWIDVIEPGAGDRARDGHVHGRRPGQRQPAADDRHALRRGRASSDALDRHLAIVGKGVCFDSGGISIKPSDRMEEMKMDKTGACTVIAAIETVARLAPGTPLLAVAPAVENMPGPHSTRPGDVVTALNGKKVDITNTDAEGRLILGDAMTYAERLGATHLVDVATLTGAVARALGHLVTGAFGHAAGLVRRGRRGGAPGRRALLAAPAHRRLRPGHGQLVRATCRTRARPRARSSRAACSCASS